MEEKAIKFYTYEWREIMTLTQFFLKAFAASVWINDIFLGTSFGKYGCSLGDLKRLLLKGHIVQPTIKTS